MRRSSLAVLALIVCPLFTPFGHAQATYQTGPPALTNAEVLKMVRAGLSDAVVVAAIREAKQTAFDVRPDALVELKAAGVSDAVLAVMLNPTSSGTPAVPATEPPAGNRAGRASPSDPLAARPAGIYIDLGEPQPHLVALEPTVFSQGKSGGLFASAMTFGLAKAKWKAIVRGARANLRTTRQQPTFYFYFEETSSGLSNTDGFGGWLAGASSPNEFVLVQMYEKPDRRELVVGEYNVFGSSTGTRSEDTVPLKIEKLAPGIYRVTPTEPLGRGEFCFFYAAGAATFGGGTLGKLFDFGVDLPGTGPPK